MYVMKHIISSNYKNHSDLGFGLLTEIYSATWLRDLTGLLCIVPYMKLRRSGDSADCAQCASRTFMSVFANEKISFYCCLDFQDCCNNE